MRFQAPRWEYRQDSGKDSRVGMLSLAGPPPGRVIVSATPDPVAQLEVRRLMEVEELDERLESWGLSRVGQGMAGAIVSF